MSLLLFLQLNVTPDTAKLPRFRVSVPKMKDCSRLNGEYCSCMHCCTSLRPLASRMHLSTGMSFVQCRRVCMRLQLLRSKPLTQFYTPPDMWGLLKRRCDLFRFISHDIRRSVSATDLFQIIQRPWFQTKAATTNQLFDQYALTESLPNIQRMFVTEKTLWYQLLVSLVFLSEQFLCVAKARNSRASWWILMKWRSFFKQFQDQNNNNMIISLEKVHGMIFLAIL